MTENLGNSGRIYWDNRQVAFRAQDGTTYFDHQDYLGTERMRTNYEGQVSWSYSSLPFGDGATAGDFGSTSAGQDPLGFATLDYDVESNTDHAQFRNYSPTQGRWLSPDPYSGSYDITNPQSLNRYAYALNNPMTNTDPSGLECVWDDGSYDASDDPDTGNANPGGCTQAGGNYIPPGLFEDVEGNQPGSWSGQANSSIAFDWNTASATVVAPNDPADASENMPKGQIQSPDCPQQAVSAAAQAPSAIPDTRSVISGVITAVVTTFLPPEYGGGTPEAATVGLLLGLGVQSAQNWIEGGLRGQAAFMACSGVSLFVPSS